ncbi:MAG: hypothetical protein IPJ55_17395 [Chloracidobacterium sp.]|nr:hypothetical protein [Chloracidobacterium sp.]
MGHIEVDASRRNLAARFQYDQWLPGSALLAAQAFLPSDTRFVLDTGSFCTIGEHALMSRWPNHIMGSSGARSMGVSLPVGIGAALGTPEIPTVVVVGDGGVRMYPETMTVAVRRNLPIIVLVMSDGYYSSVRQAAVYKGFTQKPVVLDRCRWSAVFQAMGCSSERVESQAALQQAPQSWDSDAQAAGFGAVIRSEKYLTMTEGIRWRCECLIYNTGTGSVGRRHARNFQALGCLVSCMDPRHDRLRKPGGSFFEESVPNPGGCIGSGQEFSGVVICSPPKFHVEQCRAVLDLDCRC